jgi:uncharacterized repeat protein (TIGR01451 family)
MIREKQIKKALGLVLSFLLILNPTLARVVLANGEEAGSQEEIQVENVSLEVQEESNSEGESQDTIVTGDAQSEAEVETVVNTHEETVSGEISSPEDNCTPPEGETDCPEGIGISHNNEATVNDEADSSATTGENEILGSPGDALIDTGNATASATIENEINSNIVTFEAEDEVEDPEAVDEGAGEETLEDGEETADIVINNSNQATLINESDVLADTGENVASENDGDATVATGDALAYANLVNFLNTNIVGSDFVIDVSSCTEGLTEDIDYNLIWKEVMESGHQAGLQLTSEGDVNVFLVNNENVAGLENDVDVTAASGGNEANGNGGKAKVETGEAIALANVLNFVNLNIVGSKFFLGVVNVFGDFNGNLILPRPDWFFDTTSTAVNEGIELENQSQDLPGNGIFANQNEAEIQGQVNTFSETGTNEANDNSADSAIETGNANSQSNVFSLLNTNIMRNNWFFLVVNSLGLRSGKILGWMAPNSIQNGEDESLGVYQLGLDSSSSNNNEEGAYRGMFSNSNSAHVDNDVNVSALTGQNQTNGNLGSSEINTGNATSLANVFDLVNLNIWGSRWFMGVVNILGDWQGNTVFAYPDTTVHLAGGGEDISAGESFEYAITFENQGEDEANDVSLELELPEGVSYLSDSSGLVPQFKDNKYVWQIGTLSSGQTGIVNVAVQVENDFSSEGNLSFWSWLVPEVHAAEVDQIGEIVAVAVIGTSDPESDLSNNTSSTTTFVYNPSEGKGVGDQRQPVLEITAKNNVNDFVYPGDTVTFEVTIENKSDVSSYNTVFHQELLNGIPGDFGTIAINLGTVEPGRVGKLTFGLALKDNGFLDEGHYYTIAQVFGRAPNGNQVASNEARTDFDIKYKKNYSSFEVKAAGKEEEEVLGENVQSFCPDAKVEEDILPYVFLLVLSSMYISKWSRFRFKLVNK